ncbi:GNAT family N-acetyltransferase [Paracoccus tegillarcae]|uniref:N-acetyltransferase n=1 Tax=Paracoccus tegillarcae TaxID=1529068 RepID=A0A2K9EC67_9RHOB|nr:GNAT family N-acetyltransferase [Paracoccus tegillarcae]AUH32500.1 N-acetyltransferase [Paracoccus tegillarcae]
MPTLSVDIPVLTAERLILREPREADFGAMLAFGASERTQFIGGPSDRWNTWRSFTSGIGHWVLKGFGFWSVEEQVTGTIVGRIGLIEHDAWPEPELGWHIYEGFEGKGYAYEAAMAIRDHAYRGMGLAPMISQIHPDNLRSRRLAERMGATIEREGEVVGEPCLIYRHPKVAA